MRIRPTIIVLAAGSGSRFGGPLHKLAQPFDGTTVLGATVRQAIQSQLPVAVVYAQYRGRRGHPVGFAAELYSELVLLTGDDGARRVVARYPAFGQEVPDVGVLMDVDTPADLVALRESLAQSTAALPARR